MNPIQVFKTEAYDVLVFIGAQSLNDHDDNVDVEVRLRDGQRYSATFFTLANVTTLLDRWQVTGESANGLFFWASDPIIVRRLDIETILRTVAHLFGSDELASTFVPLDDD